jgi:glucose-6-phosphate dehydrogenase assembly protein OpcA
MATNYKVLGQVEPAADTLTTVYTVPAATETIVANICIANLSSSPAAIRIAIRPNGEAIADKHYIVYDSGVDMYSYEFLTMPITLDATDVISVYSSTGTVSFNVFGSEIS